MVPGSHCHFETSLLKTSSKTTRELQEQMQKTGLLLQSLPKVKLQQLHEKVLPGAVRGATKAPTNSPGLGTMGVLELL